MKEAILICICQKWWDKIKTREKKIELRKTMPKGIQVPCTVYVYVPEQKAVCGQFTLQGVAPVQPSEELVHTSCVSLDKQQEYKGTGTLYGWLVKLPAEYNYRLNLQKLLHISRAPQS